MTDGPGLLLAVAATAAVILGLLLRTLFRPHFPKQFRAKVVWVCDGDTVWVRRFFSRRKIRLLGMDAPESEQEYGQLSQEYLDDLIGGQTVEVEAIGADIYGRWLARLKFRRQDVSLQMIEAGMAWPYYASFHNLTPAERNAYRAAAFEAKRYGRGLWRSERPEAPWTWRQRNRSLWQRLLLWIRKLLYHGER